MDGLLTALIIVAAISATRSRRNARWPLFAAITFALLPFLVRLASSTRGSADDATVDGIYTAFVAWPVAWALLAGWVLRVSKRPTLLPRTRAQIKARRP